MTEIKRRKVNCFCPTCETNYKSHVNCSDDSQLFVKRCDKCKRSLNNVNADFMTIGTGIRKTCGGKTQ